MGSWRVRERALWSCAEWVRGHLSNARARRGAPPRPRRRGRTWRRGGPWPRIAPTHPTREGGGADARERVAADERSGRRILEPRLHGRRLGEDPVRGRLVAPRRARRSRSRSRDARAATSAGCRAHPSRAACRRRLPAPRQRWRKSVLRQPGGRPRALQLGARGCGLRRPATAPSRAGWRGPRLRLRVPRDLPQPPASPPRPGCARRSSTKRSTETPTRGVTPVSGPVEPGTHRSLHFSQGGSTSAWPAPDHPDHATQGRLIRRYIAWRNAHTDDPSSATSSGAPTRSRLPDASLAADERAHEPWLRLEGL